MNSRHIYSCPVEPIYDDCQCCYVALFLLPPDRVGGVRGVRLDRRDGALELSKSESEE